MKDNNLLKTGGIFAILLGIAKLISASTYLIIPPELRAEVPGKVFLPAFAQNAAPLLVIFWVEALVGILGLGLVPALSSLLREKSEGWLAWGSNLALIGYAVSSVGYMLSIARLPAIAQAFVAGDSSTQAALAVTWKSSIDLLGFWGYAAIGLWILIVSILALRHSILPSWLAILGIVASILHILVPFGAYFKIQAVLMLAVIPSIIILPVWYIGIGMTLRRIAAK